MAEAERSFHVTCVPGRPLMWKRVPTKRKFSFSLAKVNKSKSFIKDKSVLSTGNRSTREKKTSTGENSSKVGKENVIELLKTISSKKTGSLNVTKCATTDFKRKTSALKDVKNTCERPATSNACKNFETPVLCLPPTVRRLVNIFMPSNEKTIRSIRSGVWKSSSSSETSALSSHEISSVSSNEVSGMVALKQSCPRIVEGKKRVSAENDKAFVSPEADIAVSHIASDSKDLCNEEVKSEDAPDRKRYKHSSATENGNSSKGNTFTHEDTPSNVGVPDSSIIFTEQQEILAPFELRDEKKESILETAMNKSSVSTSLPLQGAASVYDFTETSDDRNDKGNSSNESVLVVGQSTDEKIVNTPVYNNLNQLKKKNMSMRRSNIQSPHTRRDTTSLIVDRSIPHPEILLLSPSHNTSENSSFSSSGNQSYVQKNLDTCDTKHSPEKETQVAQLSEKRSNPDLTQAKDRSAKRKINFARKPTGLVIQRTRTISQNTSGGSGSTIPSDLRKRYCVSQEVVQCLKKRKTKQNLNPVVLPDDRPGFVLAPKSRKKYVRKERQPIKGKFPSKVKVLMCRKAAPKRKAADLMDLEVIFEILNSHYRKEEETLTESDEAERILKSYQKGVIRDVAALIYDSVELQCKAKEIKKLYREIEKKGKQLGTLIDQQHKIYHGIESGELRFVD